ncbi:hypothetical protein DRP04_07790 [Archaeoglobales archaeon]|nr:MAG: hypothetical protein DRP04_07790 [Archaeoglobales archaeon]
MIDEELKRILKEKEIGRPFTDETHGLGIQSDGTCDIWYVIDPEKASDLRLNDFVLIYDFLRKVWFGGRVVAFDVPRVGVADRKVELYQESTLSMIEQLEKGHIEPMRGNQIVGVELLCVIDSEGNLLAPVIPPSNASILLLPSISAEIGNEPSLTKILDLPSEGIPCGVVSHNQHIYYERSEDKTVFLEYRLNLSKMENRHILVLGTSGSGKTVFLKELAWRMANQGKAVIIADLQGDIIQIAEPPEKEQVEKLEGLEKEIWKAWKWRKTDSFPTRNLQIYAPVSSNGRLYDGEELDRIERWAQNKKIVFKKFSIRFSDISSGEELALYMPGLTDAAIGGLIDLFELYQFSTPESSRSFTHFRSFIEGATHEQREVYWEHNGKRVSMHPMTYGNLKRELSTLGTWGVFDVKGTEGLRYPDFAKSGYITIVYLQHLNERLKHIFEFFISGFMFRNRKEPEPKEKVLIIDEAHEVIPRRVYGYEENWINLITRNFSEIAREGRKYHLDLVISTHKPGDINPVVYGICGTRVIFRLPHEDVEKAGVPQEFRPVVENFAPGFCIIHSPENTKTSWLEVKIPPINCLHISPRDFFEKIEQELKGR